MIVRVLTLTPLPALAADLSERLHSLALPVVAESLLEERELRRRLAREPWDVVVLAPGPDSDPSWTTRWIRELRALPEPLEVLVLAEADGELRGQWTAAGALATLDSRLDTALLNEALQAVLLRRRERSRSELEHVEERTGRGRLSDLTSDSPAMRAFLKTARKVAASDATVLILGETGTGKEYVARALHAEGQRAQRPFIAVNCAALPESLLEAELFGHVAGAFTGATRARRGWFELADGGTLFLDEIGELPPHLQVKLLRVLQDREIQPVGASAPIRLDLRLMAATNRNLEDEMTAGRFRADLFYRLAVVTLLVPSLRERREDIPALVRARTDALARELGRPVPGTAPEARAALVAYDWPGNVRELANVIERAVLLSDGGELTVDDLPAELRRGAREPLTGPRPVHLGPYREAREATLEAFDRTYFDALLRHTAGRVGKAAELSGLTPRGLYEKLLRLGLRKEDYLASRIRPR